MVDSSGQHQGVSMTQFERYQRTDAMRANSVQCDQIWQNFAKLTKHLKAFGKIFRFYLVKL